MRNLLILGAGTSGTMMANHLRHKLYKDTWKITIVDQYKTHYYQPGFLFLPFDIYTEKQVKKVVKKFIPNDVTYIQKKIEQILPDENKVQLEDETIDYDVLIIATGSKIAPEETSGLIGPLWKKDIFDFYTFEGAVELRNKLRNWEGGKIPTNMGDEVIEKSGLGDDLNFVPTDHNTLQSLAHKNIFVIGDATNVPASKAGSVAHFEAETLTDNILLFIDGYPLKKEFDGHANCFIETGNNKALLIDFNYVTEPVHGNFPFAKFGPLKLLKESVLNHWGKLAFRWIYWNILLKGIPIPFVHRNMSFKGKIFDIKPETK